MIAAQPPLLQNLPHPCWGRGLAQAVPGGLSWGAEAGSGRGPGSRHQLGVKPGQPLCPLEGCGSRQFPDLGLHTAPAPRPRLRQTACALAVRAAALDLVTQGAALARHLRCCRVGGPAPRALMHTALGQHRQQHCAQDWPQPGGWLRRSHGGAGRMQAGRRAGVWCGAGRGTQQGGLGEGVSGRRMSAAPPRQTGRQAGVAGAPWQRCALGWQRGRQLAGQPVAGGQPVETEAGKAQPGVPRVCCCWCVG
ncbi:hypothetical protein V8C86DRAFT_2457456 [Haematococcus lacustris]